MKKSINKIKQYVLILFIIPFLSHSQVVLKADGPGETYELISSVLAPGKSAVEAPDHNKLGNHASFGRHIAEVWDADLKENVFECVFLKSIPQFVSLHSSPLPSFFVNNRSIFYI